MSNPPDTVVRLVERFDEHHDAYRSGRYNETQLRREFLDPFFDALGWDVANKGGIAEGYKEVIHEDRLETEWGNKAPDYCFYLGGERKFFVEAKKPAVNIYEGVHPAYQLRRYAWSAKLALSILTDFEELAVYDCLSMPNQTDHAGVGRFKFMTYRDYLPQWDTINGLFSREAVMRGSLDQFAETTKTKHGTNAVDNAFLAEIERWRKLLAQNIAQRNPALTQRDLNYAVQMTIDRIIFLRICEDRGIESYGQLQGLREETNIYPLMCDLFRRADQRYNSGLFHFSNEKGETESPDGLTLGMQIDDTPLKEILLNAYYPKSPYEFSVFSADILGQVYEQFLGKVIHLTGNHEAEVEDKPEVKKAGGVFYTPTYIVDYIVKNTIGKLLEGRKVGDRGTGRGDPLRVLDPACGSGSFLLGAYQYLLDWYLEGYSSDTDKWSKGRQPTIYPAQDGLWKLTTTERKRILLDHIYGVDIDPQAVEVTKLSLLLKVLEGENERTLGRQLSLWQERALPDLGKNIKCGNSLIGPDFYDGRQLSLLDEEVQYRINVFDWKKNFEHVFQGAGGFDAIIGNPPYVRQEGLGEAKNYLQSHYQVFRSTADLYVYFIEKGITLLNPSGLFGIIVSNKWFRAAYGEPLRDFLSTKTTIKEIIDFAGLPVFKSATVRTVVIICAPTVENNKQFTYLAPVSVKDFPLVTRISSLETIVKTKGRIQDLKNFSKASWSFSEGEEASFIAKMRLASINLRNYIQGKPYRGILTGKNEAFVIDKETRERLINGDPKCAEIIKPLVVGRDIRRYSLDYKERYLIWTYLGVPIDQYPPVYNHLVQYQADLEKRCDQGNYWWELRACAYYDKFFKPKIIYPDISTNCRFTLDRDSYFGTNTTYFIPGDDRYLLGILNSKLANYYFSKVCAGLEGGGEVYLRFFGQYMDEFPVHSITRENSKECENERNLIALVDGISILHQRLKETMSPLQESQIKRQIEATDHQIDRLVYELYGLTEEEILIVEGKG